LKRQAVSRSHIDRVTCFIPRLDAIPEDKISDFHCHTKADGTVVISLEPTYHPTIMEMMQAFRDNNFVQPFDWVKWQSAAAKFFHEPQHLPDARLSTCIKLITLHIRKDRFVGGHFGRWCGAGS